MTTDDDSREPELIQLRFLVKHQYHGWRLDQFIKARIPRLSRNRIQKMIHTQAALGGANLRPSTRVHMDQEVMLLRVAPEEPDVPRTYRVIFEDAFMLALDKPSGLPVHSTARFFKNTLAAVLRERYPAGQVPSMAHRLDRETSGIMLFGRSKAAGTALKEAFRHRQVKKRYLAIVHGWAPDQGVVDRPLGPDMESGIRIKMSVTVAGQGMPSVTRFRTLERRGPFSLVEAFPETGRQHQIRVHLAAAGHPLVGDKLYGQDPATWLEYIETGMTPPLMERLLLPRHALHASMITFPHPDTGEQTTLGCDLAEELVAFWDKAGSTDNEGQAHDETGP